MKPRWSLFITLLLLACFTYVSSLAVMSVDLGSEWMKVGIVSPGVPMEIALNKESKRKTAVVIAFRDNIRTFGEDAQTVGIRFPHLCYGYLIDLLGKSIDNPIVQNYQKRFPYYNIVEDKERGTILFKLDESTYYSPEELLAQILYKAKEMAEQSANQQISDVVITVPGYFNQIERQAVLQVAQLANLKVLQLINDYTAVALNYGIYRRKDFNDTANYVLFYDMGASKTTAAIVSYQNVKTKERGIVETNPQLSIIGVGYDRQLGGLEMQTRLRDYLAKKFNEMKVTTSDVTKNPRALAKLFKEAGRLKNVLSANADHFAQTENLIDEKDFRMQITREEFETMCADLFERVSRPIEDSLKMAGLSMDVISQVVLVGGGTRVPKVQEQLQKFVKMELSKNINADEAATMGAVYKAADLSTGFKVKKFVIKDGVLLPIQITFERELEKTDEKDTPQTKIVKRTLFSLMNPYPQKKIITFNRYTDNFKFNVNHADLDHLSVEEIQAVGSLNISQVELKNISDAVGKFDLKQPNLDPKGVKAHFLMDDSGLLNLVHVDFVVEKNVTDDEAEESWLGSTLSNLFKSAEETEKPTENATAEGENIEATNTTENATATNQTETEKNATSESAPSASTAAKKSKIVVIKEPIGVDAQLLTVKPMTPEQFDGSRKKILDLNSADFERNRRETALNNLESFVIDLQNRLYSDEYTHASTSTEIDTIKQKCSEISDWLYEDGSDATAEKYDEKLKEIQKLTRDLYSRVYEHKERPEALKTLAEMLNGSQSFLKTAKNYSKGVADADNEIFTEIEVTKLEMIINETQDWKDNMEGEQKKLKKSDPVKLTIRAISEKMGILDREVKYLINKMKIWRPKTPPKPVHEKDTESKAKDTKKKNDTDKDDKDKEAQTEKDSDEGKADEVREKDDVEEGVEIDPTDEKPVDDHTEL